jgi:hypothetical protein
MSSVNRRITWKELVVIPLAAACAIALIAYRDWYVPSFDDTGGGWDGWVAVVVDLGFCFAIPAILAPSIVWTLFVLGLKWIGRLLDKCFRSDEWPSDRSHSPLEWVTFRVPLVLTFFLVGWVGFLIGTALLLSLIHS